MIALFILKLSAGIALMWLLMPRSEVTDGFFRIQMRLLLGLAVLAALLLSTGGTWSVATEKSARPGELSDAHSLPEMPGAAEDSADQSVVSDTSQTTAQQLRLIAIAAAVVAYAGSIFWALGRRLPGRICIYLIAAATVAATGLHSFRVPNESALPLQVLSDFSSAAVLGSVITGMLLGHWYLTTPTMSIRPLSWFVTAIAVSAVARLFASGWAAAQFGVAGDDLTRSIWLGIRWIGGIIVPLAAAFVVWKILKYRNTQSATGVLFAALILVFMGEMAAALLERDVRVPY